jgi:hypothetical protein
MDALEGIMKISRRRFVEASALGCVATLLSGPSFAEARKMPMRVFGKTGEKVPILAFGAGSRYLMYQLGTGRLTVSNRPRQPKEIWLIEPAAGPRRVPTGLI